jgi:hypothetical protein
MAPTKPITPEDVDVDLGSEYANSLGFEDASVHVDTKKKKKRKRKAKAKKTADGSEEKEENDDEGEGGAEDSEGSYEEGEDVEAPALEDEAPVLEEEAPALNSEVNENDTASPDPSFSEKKDKTTESHGESDATTSSAEASIVENHASA